MLIPRGLHNDGPSSQELVGNCPSQSTREDELPTIPFIEKRRPERKEKRRREPERKARRGRECPKEKADTRRGGGGVGGRS